MDDEQKVALGSFEKDGKTSAMFVVDPNSRYPFQFGLAKAKKLVDPDVQKALSIFVESNGTAID